MGMDNLIEGIERQEIARPETFKAFMYIFSALDNKEVMSVDGMKYEEDNSLL